MNTEYKAILLVRNKSGEYYAKSIEVGENSLDLTEMQVRPAKFFQVDLIDLQEALEKDSLISSELSLEQLYELVEQQLRGK